MFIAWRVLLRTITAGSQTKNNMQIYLWINRRRFWAQSHHSGWWSQTVNAASGSKINPKCLWHHYLTIFRSASSLKDWRQYIFSVSSPNIGHFLLLTLGWIIKTLHSKSETLWLLRKTAAVFLYILCNCCNLLEISQILKSIKLTECE